jgi:hypothetical protein
MVKMKKETTMSSAWTCSHQIEERCDLLGKPCDPGDNGCVLYGKALFSNPLNPSNEALRRKEERRKAKARKEEIDNARFF